MPTVIGLQPMTDEIFAVDVRTMAMKLSIPWITGFPQHLLALVDETLTFLCDLATVLPESATKIQLSVKRDTERVIVQLDGVQRIEGEKLRLLYIARAAPGGRAPFVITMRTFFGRINLLLYHGIHFALSWVTASWIKSTSFTLTGGMSITIV